MGSRVRVPPRSPYNYLTYQQLRSRGKAARFVLSTNNLSCLQSPVRPPFRAWLKPAAGRATWAIEPGGDCVKPQDAVIRELIMRPCGDSLPFGFPGLDQ